MSLEQLTQYVIDGKAEAAQELVKELLKRGVSANAILDDGLLKGMEVVGRLFKNEEIFVPEVLCSARAMDFGVKEIKPFMAEGDATSKGTIVIGTVKGDVHDIGKNLVCMMFEGAGFKVIDLGVGVPTEKLINAVKEYRPDILGLSALLTTTMQNMKDVIDLLKEEGLRDSVKVMVGGAPIDQSFADSIGADGYAENGGEAVEIAKTLLNIK